MDYSKMLNLPKTDFPMRGNLPQREPEIQKWWQDVDIYSKVQESRQGKTKFILHDGPPYANGDVHLGHALNKILKDIIVKYKTMQGFDSPYVPGWDTHGLPIEHAIIKNNKIDRHKISVTDFRALCAEYAKSFIDKQRQQFLRMGVRGDWFKPYVTLEPAYEAEQIKVFGEMAKKGYIYKGKKPVYWCADCETALAEAEIEYHDKTSKSIYVAFPIKDGKGILSEENSHVMIWTTTPWTIPANLAIALHPKLEYTFLVIGDKKYLVATEMVEDVVKIINADSYTTEGNWVGSELENIIASHPIYKRDSILILGEHVTTEQGTGCVHTAPGHGMDDYIVGNKYGLDVYAPIDYKGHFTEAAGIFAGMYYVKANKEVIKVLEESGFLLHQEDMVHQYPHCWRCKGPVIYRATEQWFASIDGFRQQMLEEIKKVQWIPTWGEQRMHNMIADRGDWCISRQRVWGVPIPIIYCEDCSEPLINEHIINNISDTFKSEGSQAWWLYDADKFLPSNYKCNCGGQAFRKETDIMDVWFDSGSSHAAVAAVRPELAWPTDMYLEGSDQYRGWFNSSLSTAVATRNQAPYKAVLSHGWVVDGEGRKMSKSLGNGIDPLDVVNKMGADILRLWVSSSEYKADIRISQNILQQMAEVYRKVRNTLRFLLGNLHDFDVNTQKLDYSQLHEIDKYALVQLNRMVEKATRAYERYDFHVVFHAVHNYCTIDLSAFYLDVLKSRIYLRPVNNQDRRAAQTVLHEILMTLVKVITPILSHTAEETWKHINDKHLLSPQMAYWPTTDAINHNQNFIDKWDRLVNVREEILKPLELAREKKIIGSSLAAQVTIYCEAEMYEFLQQVNDLQELLIVSKVVLYEDVKKAPIDAHKIDGAAVVVEAAAGEKCERCWIITEELGQVNNHPTICPACAEDIKGF